MKKIKKKIKEFWAVIDDFVLEVGRLALLGTYGSVFPFVLAKLEVLSTQGAIIWAVVLLAFLKALDRWLYEKGYIEKGITRF